MNVTHKRQTFHFFKLSISAANQAFDVYFNISLISTDNKFDIQDFTSSNNDFININNFTFNLFSRFLIPLITLSQSQKIEEKSLFLNKLKKL